MGLSILPSGLISRIIRFNSANGTTGSSVLSAPLGNTLIVSPRRINNISRVISQPDQNGGILGYLWNGATAFTGWLFGGSISFLSFSFTAVWGWLLGKVEEIKSFNWNLSDAQLKQGMKDQNLAIAAAWGGAIGQGVGWLAGIGVGYGISYLCPVIGGGLLGRFRASATLNTGRPLIIYGATKEEAENRLKAFLTLSDAQILSLNITEEMKEASRVTYPQLFKEPTQLYPAFFTILNREQVLNTSRSRASLRQGFRDKRARVDLWTSVEPTGTQDIITEILTKGVL